MKVLFAFRMIISQFSTEASRLVVYVFDYIFNEWTFMNKKENMEGEVGITLKDSWA